LEGTARWRKEGLITPNAVLMATDEYRGEMDVIGNFLKECCVQGKDCTIRIRELYKGYADWCDENNEHAVNERFFTMRLKDIGFVQARKAEVRFWGGLQMKDDIQ
jgi:putative DNA primase/helicase